MALNTFNRFSSLPPELRHEIWTLAVEPRLVVLTHSHFFTLTHNYKNEQLLTPIYVLKENHLDHDYLFSRSPIPPSLHVCQESRFQMLKLGYELAFGTENAKPLTWFNFQTDILYLIKSPMLRDEFFARNRFDFNVAQEETWWNATRAGGLSLSILPEDLIRIKRIAVLDTTTIADINPGPMFFDSPPYSARERSLELYELALKFGGLKELLIVEKHVGNKVRDRRDDLWDDIECSGIDAKAGVWKHGRLLSRVHYGEMDQYAKENRCDWSGYFKWFGTEWEVWFMTQKKLASTAPQTQPPGLPPRDYRSPVRPSAAITTIPWIKVVAVMPKTEISKLVAARQNYRDGKPGQVDVGMYDIVEEEEGKSSEAQKYWGHDYEPWDDITGQDA